MSLARYLGPDAENPLDCAVKVLSVNFHLLTYCAQLEVYALSLLLVVSHTTSHRPIFTLYILY